MRRLPVAALAFAAALLTTACEDQPTSPRPALLPHAAISDAANGGANSAIYFLPPVTDQPNIVGQVNPNLTTAVIRICKMVDGACTQVIASFGAGQSTGPLVIASNHYLATWHVASSTPAVIVGAAYRIEVFTDNPGSDLSAVPEAWADVQAVNSGKEFKNLKTNDIVPLLPNGTLPIKVWIGSDVRCESTNCVSAVVDNTGGTLVLTSGNGALLLQAGWLPPGLSNVTVTLQRHPPGPNNDCVGKAAFTGPGLIAQRESCLQVTTDPVIVPGRTTGIQKAAFVYLCTESDEEDPFHEFLQVIKADDGRPLEALKDVSHAELLALGFVPSCEGTPSDLGMNAHPLMRLAARGLHAITRPVARLLEVKPLYAIDLGQGGEIGIFGGFSYFTLGVVAELEKVGELPETVEAGTSQSLDVRVTSLTEHPPGEPVREPLEDVSVRFTVTDGDGGLFDPNDDGDLVDEVTVQTGEGEEGAGFANVNLLVGEGTNVVEAVVIGPDGKPVSEPVTFIVTGTEIEGITFETYPSGAGTCEDCAIVGEYVSRGVVFAFEPRDAFRSALSARLVLNGAFEPVDVSNNHSVTSPWDVDIGQIPGTVVLYFPSAPRTVTFRLRGQDNVANPFPVSAYSGPGEPLSESQITRSGVSTYDFGSETPGRQETVTFTSDDGISRIGVHMLTFSALIDNVVIGAVPAGLINFETTPAGAPICGTGCDVTTAFASRGVTFSFVSFSEGDTRTHASICDGSRIDPLGFSMTNHLVTVPNAYPCGGGTAGQLVMTFSPAPTAVRFGVREPDGCSLGVSAVGADEGDPFISTGDVFHYTSGNLFTAEQVFTRVTHPGGIESIRLTMVGCSEYLDNLVIINSSP